MSAFENRDYADGYRDGTRFAEVTITALRAEVEKLRAGLFDCMQEAANHHRENEARAKIGGSDMAQRKAKAIVARSGVLFHNIKAIARAALEEKQ